MDFNEFYRDVLWVTIRFHQLVLIGQKRWLPVGGIFLPYMAIVQTLKIFFLGCFQGSSMKFTGMFLGFYIRFLQLVLIGKKKWPQVGGAHQPSLLRRATLGHHGPLVFIEVLSCHVIPCQSALILYLGRTVFHDCGLTEVSPYLFFDRLASVFVTAGTVIPFLYWKICFMSD